MTEKEKLEALEEMMELDAGILTPDTDTDSIDEWDSMTALLFVVFMEEKFNKTVTGAQIRAFRTVRDMLDMMTH